MERLATQVSHGFRRKGLDLSPRVIVLFMLLIALVLVLAAVRVALTTRVIVSARQLQDMRSGYTDVQRENSTLELDIAKQQGTSFLLRRAEDLGFGIPVEFEIVER
jgi:hypothetical protein